MPTKPVLIDGEWRDARDPVGAFRPVDPARGEELPDSYPVSSFRDVEGALEAARRATPPLIKASPDSLAAFLEFFASEIEKRADELVDLAHLETALPKDPRLRSVELPRTTSQLRQAAAAARDRTWCRATIDTKTNIRSKYSPLGGPVAVFGPNNFPFAFNSAGGGDVAAAIASGNPVIAKGNPGHPGTTRIFAEIALSCLKKTGLPAATLQLIYHLRPEDGFVLVSHPFLGCTSFTGSRPAGLALKAAADKGGKPIYLEMSSTNPIFLLPGAVKERAEQISGELAASCLMGSGQFCTKPGLFVVLRGEESDKFIVALRESFDRTPPGCLLSRNVLDRITAAVNSMCNAGAVLVTRKRSADGPGFRYPNTLLRVSGDSFLRHPKDFEQEAFGTVSLIVVAADFDQMLEMAAVLEGNLTAGIFSHTRGDDDQNYARLEPLLRSKVGRLLNDKMPTGVAVTPAMVHGGPYPATGHPGFTAVGYPPSMLRFAALHGYDHVRHDRLPPELQDKNPTGCMWRLIDGEWSQRDI